MEVINALTRLPEMSKGQLDYLESLSVLVEDYEETRWEEPNLSPLDLLQFLMEQHGMNASDLGRLLGERSLGPKILNGDRDLSKTHIRKLAEKFAVNPGLFL